MFWRLAHSELLTTRFNKMTREKFIKKWLGNKDYQYTEQNRDLMRDDLDEVINQALHKTDVSGSYIRIEIVDYFGTKKVIEVKPYFDKQQLTEIEFLNAIRLLEEEKNKATYAFV